MSRLKRFANSLLSGYAQLVAQAIFSLTSIPMALHYLPTKAEFGLWGVATQMASYVALIDFGLAGAASRLLVDYKDHEDRAQYGSMVVTSALVGITQGALIFLLGIGAGFLAGPILHVPAVLEQKLFWLVVGQGTITGVMFAARIVNHVLISHQRYDVSNLSSAFSLFVNLGAMWWGFRHDLGVYAMLLGQACAISCVVLAEVVCCLRLQLLPRRGEWGRPTREKFKALFSYGSDLFFVIIGNQLINASQTILVTRFIGLDAAAVWTGCTRSFLLLVQVVTRIFDYSTAALAEMMVRGEKEILRRRFRDIVMLIMNLGVVAGAFCAICNGTFVHVWTSGKLQWPALNDFLMGTWLVVTLAVRVHCNFVGQTKVFGFLRYIFFLEGLVFVSFTLLLHRFGGITTMLSLSILCSLSFSLPYGLWRTCQYFQIDGRELARWHRPALLLFIAVTPFGMAVWLLSAHLPPIPRLVVEVVLDGPWSLWIFLRYGLGDSLRADLGRLLPARLRPWLA